MTATLRITARPPVPRRRADRHHRRCSRPGCAPCPAGRTGSFDGLVAAAADA